MFERGNRRIFHAGKFENDGFNFRKFNPETANLNLSVAAPDKFNVAGAVNIFVLIAVERIFDKNFGVFLWTIERTGSNLQTSRPKFAAGSDWNFSTLNAVIKIVQLPANLRRHERVRDAVFLEVIIHRLQGEEHQFF